MRRCSVRLRITATASGLDSFLISYYRDKGYGMGYCVGLLGVGRGQAGEDGRSCKTFPESEANTRQWKRWFRFLLLDQWGVFFTGALLGMTLPATLVGYLASAPGAAKATAAIYAGLRRLRDPALGRRRGVVLPGVGVGFLIPFSTQMVVFETLVRNMTDALYATSARFRNAIHHNPQRFYYPFMLALLAVMAIISFQALPTQLITWAANMSNFASCSSPWC